MREDPQRGHHIQGEVGIGGRVRHSDARGRRVKQSLVSAAEHWPGGSPPHPIQAGIYHDPVQPGGHRRVATETIGASECRDHRVL
jgi:hypothetical protein